MTIPVSRNRRLALATSGRNPAPWRGEIWDTDFGTLFGHEPGYRRPALIVSDNLLNQGFSGLCVVVPLSTVHHDAAFHIAVEPPDGGVRSPSWIQLELIRSIDTSRLVNRWGRVRQSTMATVDQRLKDLLNLP